MTVKELIIELLNLNEIEAEVFTEDNETGLFDAHPEIRVILNKDKVSKKIVVI